MERLPFEYSQIIVSYANRLHALPCSQTVEHWHTMYWLGLLLLNGHWCHVFHGFTLSHTRHVPFPYDMHQLGIVGIHGKPWLKHITESSQTRRNENLVMRNIRPRLSTHDEAVTKVPILYMPSTMIYCIICCINIRISRRRTHFVGESSTKVRMQPTCDITGPVYT